MTEPWREVVRELVAALRDCHLSSYREMETLLRERPDSCARCDLITRAEALLKLDATQSEESDDH